MAERSVRGSLTMRIGSVWRPMWFGVLTACVVAAGLSFVPSDDPAQGGGALADEVAWTEPSEVEAPATASPTEGDAEPVSEARVEESVEGFDPFNVLPQADDGGGADDLLGEVPAVDVPVDEVPVLDDVSVPVSDSVVTEELPPAPVDAAVPVDDVGSGEPVVFDGPGLDPGVYDVPVLSSLPDEPAAVLEVAAADAAELGSVTVSVIDVSTLGTAGWVDVEDGSAVGLVEPLEEPVDLGALAAHGDADPGVGGGDGDDAVVDDGDDLAGELDELPSEIGVSEGPVESPPLAGALLAFTVSGDAEADAQVAIDVSQLAFESAGDRAERLRLVEFPECAVTDPQEPSCAKGEVIEGSAIDAVSLVLEAEIDVDVEPAEGDLSTQSSGGGGSIYALMSATGSEAGNFGATPFAAAGSWAAGSQSGGFSYSYPLPMSAGIAGPTPQLSLGYSSQSVDAMTTETNNQPGPVGIGWSLSGVGYIERTYQPCGVDGTAGLHPNDVGKDVDEELCWIGNNASIVLNGVSSRLVPVNGSGDAFDATEWVLENDPGWKVERVTNPVGPLDENRFGEYWVITDLSGARYTFGQSAASALNVPVLSNNANEPCWGDENENASGASRWCSLPWRWNLDNITDLNGNEVDFRWGKESNRYNKVGLYPTPYDRDGYLITIRYGINDDARSDGRDHMAIDFFYGDRCFTGCSNDANWLDTPRDLLCPTGSCSASAPAFFSTKRLREVRSYVRTHTSGWVIEHQVKLNQRFSSSGKLWLESIDRRGWGGWNNTATWAPRIGFGGTLLDNRAAPGGYEMLLPRISVIVDELARETLVYYGQPSHSGNASACRNGDLGYVPGNVSASQQVNWDENRSYCFPAWYEGVPIVFNKYVVTQVVDKPRVGAAPSGTNATITTQYFYDRPGWDKASPLYATGNELYNDFVGHSRVETRVGGSGQGSTVTYFHRGMHGSDASYDTRVGPSNGLVTDHAWLRGQVRETATVDGGGSVQHRQVFSYLEMPPAYTSESHTFSWGSNRSTTISSDMVRQRTDLHIQVDAGSRQTLTVTSYDEFGTPTDVRNDGDRAIAADDTCTRTSSNYNASLHLLVPREVKTRQGDNCASGSVLAHSLLFYDENASYTYQPTKGLLTRTIDYASSNTSNKVETQTRYDDYGRPDQSWVVDPNATHQAIATTTYAPPTGPALTITSETVVDNVTVPGSRSVANFHLRHMALRYNDQPGGVDTRNLYDYDGLGRLTKVWAAGRSRSETPNVLHTYTISSSVIRVDTTTLVEDNNTVTTSTYYDSFGRVRETHAPSPRSGYRLVTATVYDHRGVTLGQSQPYADAGSVTSGLDNRSFSQVPVSTITFYDSLKRPTRIEQRDNNVATAATTIAYNGARVTTTDPVGDQTWQETNTRGQLSKSFDGAGVTTYAYTSTGELATVVAPGGATTQITYDWLGRKTSHSDPDSGVWNYAYNDKGLLEYEWTGERELRTEYDALNRPERLCTTTTGGAGNCAQTLRTWDYHDTGVGAGLLREAISYQNGHAYTQTFVYNRFGKPTSQTTTIPAVEGNLAGSYTTTINYDATGAAQSITHPAIADLPAETINYHLDTNGQLDQITSSHFAYVSNITHYDDGKLQMISLGQSGAHPAVNISRSYDPATGRVVRINATGGKLDLNYDYFADGNIFRIYDAKTNQTEDYRYDDAKRITFARTRLGDTTTGPADWRYEGFDMRWSYTASGSIEQHINYGRHINNYTYDTQRNAVDRIQNDNYTPSWETFQYNNEGARESWQTPDGTGNYTYYPTGEMRTSANLNGSGPLAANATTYTYDINGQRLIARNGDGSATLWIGDQRIERAANGALSGYRHVNTPAGPGAVRAGSGVSLVMTDHLGSTRATIASNGVVTDHRYDPFGKPRTNLNTAPTDRGYTGQVRDNDRLSYYNARYYDPGIGQFTQPDTIVPDPTSGVDYNRYAYVRNNPLFYNDPSGHIAFAIPVAYVLYTAVAATAAATLYVALSDTERMEAIHEGWSARAEWIKREAWDRATEQIDQARSLAYTVEALVTAEASEPEPAEAEPRRRKPPEPSAEPTYDDPTAAPDEGWVWTPPDSEVGGEIGAWHNPDTEESWKPDLNHPDPIGPHWDYTERFRRGQWRVFPDGTWTPK